MSKGYTRFWELFDWLKYISGIKIERNVFLRVRDETFFGNFHLKGDRKLSEVLVTKGTFYIRFDQGLVLERKC